MSMFSQSTTHRTGRKLDFLIIAVLLLVIGVLIYQRLHSTVPSITSGVPEKSIAVLPFENRSEDKTNTYFADGIQDEILTRLSTQHYKSARKICLRSQRNWAWPTFWKEACRRAASLCV
jgi:hypothetical protein